MPGKRPNEHWNIDYAVSPTIDETAGEIKRRVAPSSGVLEGWIVCTTPVFFRAHFIGDKTIPHLRENCPGCKAKNLGECRAYIFVFERQQQLISAVDLPLGALPALKQALAYHHTLKGLPISLARRGKGIRARVMVSIGQTINPEMSMLPVPSLTEWCENLWAEHLRQMVFATDGASPPTSERDNAVLRDQERSAAPKRRRQDRPVNRIDEHGNPEPIAIGGALEELIRRQADQTVSKVNGHPADAS